MRQPRVVPFLITIAALCTMGGCGGSGNQETPTGRAVLTFVWPDRTRLIPAAANSITVTLTRGGALLASQVVPRRISSIRCRLLLWTWTLRRGGLMWL